MTSACKFIDFFVHDILDYTILNEEDRNFIKESEVLDIKEAIDEIMEIQEDKIKMKNIRVKSYFYGFSEAGNYLVKSDQKRIQ